MAALLTWPDLTGRSRPEPDVTIAYGADPMHRIDLWRPASDAPSPVVLMVHGGCWTTAIADRTLMNWIAADLRDHGLAVWNIDYRGVDLPGGGYPGTFLDAAAAADRLALEAGRYRLATDRIVAIGHSAGGHLALWLAARPRLPKTSPLASAAPLPIAHVVSLGGLPDLERTAARTDNGCGVEVVGQLVGTPAPDRPDVYADTSVTRLLPIGVPQDLINGEQDLIIPADFGPDYAARAETSGDTVKLTMLADTGHVELVTPDSLAWAVARKAIMTALDRD